MTFYTCCTQWSLVEVMVLTHVISADTSDLYVVSFTGIFRVFPLFLQEHWWCHKRCNVSCPGGTVTISNEWAGVVEVSCSVKRFAENVCVFCSLRQTGGPSSSQWTPSGQISAVQTGVHCIHLVANFTLKGCDCWPRQTTTSRSKLWPTVTQWVWTHLQRLFTESCWVVTAVNLSQTFG